MYDVICVGGGLAGAAYANLMAQKGLKVMVIEKDTFPRHKVCGEYVSMESYQFLERLGLKLNSLDLPRISHFTLSNTKGKTFNTELDLGGFGISRFLLDDLLKQAAIKAGVTWETAQITQITGELGGFQLLSNDSKYTGKQVVGAWGKRAGLDRELKRPFYFDEKSRLTNWLGIKHHIRTDFSPKHIALHTFKNGYCGISKIENDKYCLCYLMRASNLQGRSIEQAEQDILAQNPFLKSIFSQSDFLYDKPLAISQVNFKKKSKMEGHMLMLGDTAGLIAPLSGNGMSIALRSAFMASENPTNYEKEWTKEFGSRMQLGRTVQYFFGRPALMNGFVAFANAFPPIANGLIKKSHGKPF
jgi:menaquinone-9 beta-reductase